MVKAPLSRRLGGEGCRISEIQGWPTVLASLGVAAEVLPTPDESPPPAVTVTSSCGGETISQLCLGQGSQHLLLGTQARPLKRTMTESLAIKSPSFSRARRTVSSKLVWAISKDQDGAVKSS